MWRAQIDKAINVNEVCDVNPFGVAALTAAYTLGEPWRLQLCDYVWHNYVALCQAFASSMPRAHVLRLEGTYLVWVDIRDTGMSSAQAHDRLLREAKVRVSPGTIYGQAGEGYIRINIACPRSQLNEALLRMKSVLA